MDIRRLATVAFTVIACGLLAGCLTPPLATLVAPPVYNFVTTDEIALRDGAEDESPVVAILPKGTPVAPVGVNSECVCWKVEALGHTGYVYNRYLSGPILTADMVEQ
ncbi:MAG TPA: SH3 domain-containing protein [Stellaceae bacterium]|jgi:hypothetical protein|nr:SH3 domain-containing protein [Stellaceae bacterium]